MRLCLYTRNFCSYPPTLIADSFFPTKATKLPGSRYREERGDVDVLHAGITEERRYVASVRERGVLERRRRAGINRVRFTPSVSLKLKR